MCVCVLTVHVRGKSLMTPKRLYRHLLWFFLTLRAAVWPSSHFFRCTKTPHRTFVSATCPTARNAVLDVHGTQRRQGTGFLCYCHGKTAAVLLAGVFAEAHCSMAVCACVRSGYSFPYL